MATKANATKATKASTKKSAVKATKAKAKATSGAAKAKPAAPPATGSKLAREIAALAKLTKVPLQKRYQEVFGHETQSHNSNQLRGAIAKRLTEQANGKTDAKKAKAKEERGVATGERDPRTPKVGTVITREYNGKEYKVNVLDDGFEYAGKKHRSLSGLAKEITGAIHNGWVWFKLVNHPSSKKGAGHAS